MSRHEVPVFVEAPDDHVPRTAWALDTLLSVSGAHARVVRDRQRAGDCRLAYAPAPVAGLPTIPVSVRAVELFRAGAALPAGSFEHYELLDARCAGAFAVSLEDRSPQGFAIPFDAVASAFLLLAAWDEHTSGACDELGRFPYAASMFAQNPALELTDPAVDAYAAMVRQMVETRRPARGRRLRTGGAWGSAGFAVAATHDVDAVRRWTRQGYRGALKRAARGVLGGHRETWRPEMGAVLRGLAIHTPRGTDPYWTFPRLVDGEATRGARSTFFLLNEHTRADDGGEPAEYARLLPKLIRIVGAAGCEIGLHGSQRDTHDGRALGADRAGLAALAGAEITGVRYHYLRCLYHESLPLLDEAGFSYDSSIACAELEGFRCGCSFPFHPYDLARERPLGLLEMPLAVMDSTLQEPRYRGLDPEAAFLAAAATLERVRASGGAAAILWHQNRFDPYLGKGFGDVYWWLLDWIRDSGGKALPAGEAAAAWRNALGEPAPDGTPAAVRRWDA